jgi:hypothetical protein
MSTSSIHSTIRLLRFDGKLIKRDGTILKVCKPGQGGAPLPLFAEPAGEPRGTPYLDGDFFETLILEGLGS